MISVGPGKPSHTLFSHFKQISLVGDFSPMPENPPKVHAVSVDLDIPPLTN